LTRTRLRPRLSPGETAVRRRVPGRVRSPPASAHTHLHVAKAPRRRPVPYPGGLGGLPLATVRRAPQGPVLPASHRVARTPEFRGDAGVVGVAVHLRELAALDAPGDLAPELEVHSFVVDRPRLVRGHEDAVLRVADDVGERPLARLDVDVGHADQWEVLPAVRPHGPGGRTA